MKKYRIVADSFAGYEAQVKYLLFPFKWFQLSHYKGVNSWATPEEALEFIGARRAGKIEKNKMQETDVYEVEFKFFRKTGISSTKNVAWQERFLEYMLQKNTDYAVAGMMMLEAA